MEKKKNVLAYISLVCFALICGILGFVIGTQQNTPDENGVKNTNNNNTMTKSEYNNYISKFTKYFDLEKEFDNISEISDYEKLLFAFRVYINGDFKQQHVIPIDEIEKIINEYFGIKGFKYNPKDDDEFKYDDEKKSYIIGNYASILKTRTSASLVATISDILNDNNGKIIKVNLSGETITGECSILLNDNNNIIAYKQTNNNKYEKINYEVEKKGENEYARYKLRVNNKEVMEIACEECISVVQLQDVLVMNSCASDCGFYILDKNGNILKSFNTENDNIKLKGLHYNYHRVDGNDIIIGSTDMWYGTDFGTICNNINTHKKENKPVNFEEKITYLGNGKFSEPTLIRSDSADEEEKVVNEKYQLDCSKYK